MTLSHTIFTICSVTPLCISKTTSKPNKLLFSKETTNPHCLFPIRKLIDITHMGSWHSCLLSSETLAPFLEFPREWPSFTLRCLGWGHSSSQSVDCRGLEEQIVYGGQQLSSFLKSLFSGSCTSCGDTIGCYMHKTQLCPQGCRLIETASLIAKINLCEWRASFFKRRIQNTIRRKAKSLRSLFFFYCWPSAEVYWRHFQRNNFP